MLINNKKGQATNIQILLLFEFILGIIVAGTLIFVANQSATNYALAERYLARDIGLMMDTVYAAPGDVDATIPIGDMIFDVSIGKERGGDYYLVSVNDKEHTKFLYANDQNVELKPSSNIELEKPQAIKFLKKNNDLDITKTSIGVSYVTNPVAEGNGKVVLEFARRYEGTRLPVANCWEAVLQIYSYAGMTYSCIYSVESGAGTGSNHPKCSKCKGCKRNTPLPGDILQVPSSPPNTEHNVIFDHMEGNNMVVWNAPMVGSNRNVWQKRTYRPAPKVYVIWEPVKK